MRRLAVLLPRQAGVRPSAASVSNPGRGGLSSTAAGARDTLGWRRQLHRQQCWGAHAPFQARLQFHSSPCSMDRVSQAGGKQDATQRGGDGKSKARGTRGSGGRGNQRNRKRRHRPSKRTVRPATLPAAVSLLRTATSYRTTAAGPRNTTGEQIRLGAEAVAEMAGDLPTLSNPDLVSALHSLSAAGFTRRWAQRPAGTTDMEVAAMQACISELERRWAAGDDPPPAVAAVHAAFGLVHVPRNQMVTRLLTKYVERLKDAEELFEDPKLLAKVLRTYKRAKLERNTRVGDHEEGRKLLASLTSAAIRHMGAFSPGDMAASVSALVHMGFNDVAGAAAEAWRDRLGELSNGQLLSLVWAVSVTGTAVDGFYAAVCDALSARELEHMEPAMLVKFVWLLGKMQPQETALKSSSTEHFNLALPGNPGEKTFKKACDALRPKVKTMESADVALLCYSLRNVGALNDPVLLLYKEVCDVMTIKWRSIDGLSFGHLVGAVGNTLAFVNNDGLHGCNFEIVHDVREHFDSLLEASAARLAAHATGSRPMGEDHLSYFLRVVSHSDPKYSHTFLQAVTEELSGETLAPDALHSLAFFISSALGQVERLSEEEHSAAQAEANKLMKSIGKSAHDHMEKLTLNQCAELVWALGRYQAGSASSLGSYHIRRLYNHERAELFAGTIAACGDRVGALLSDVELQLPNPASTRSQQSQYSSPAIGRTSSGDEITAPFVTRLVTAYASTAGLPGGVYEVLDSVSPVVRHALPYMKDTDVKLALRAFAIAVADEHASFNDMLERNDDFAVRYGPVFEDCAAEMGRRVDMLHGVDIAQTSWVLAALGYSPPAWFESLFNGVALRCHPFDESHMNQLYQAHLMCQLEQSPAQSLALPPDLTDQYTAVFKAWNRNMVSGQRSSHHLHVSAVLKTLGVEHQNEFQIPEGFVIDIAVPEQKIAMEVQGPFHYLVGGMSERLTLGTIFKNRLLRKLGWTVVNIPWTHYSQVRQDVDPSLPVGQRDRASAPLLRSLLLDQVPGLFDSGSGR